MEIKYFLKKSPFLHWKIFFLHKLQQNCLLFWHWFQLSSHLNFDWWDQSKHIFRQALKYRFFLFPPENKCIFYYLPRERGRKISCFTNNISNNNNEKPQFWSTSQNFCHQCDTTFSESFSGCGSLLKASL